MNFEKIDESPVLDELVKKAVEEAFERISSKYELHATALEAVESRSRDGFISSNDGGWSARGFSDISMLTGSGRASSLPEEASTKIGELETLGFKYALESFKAQYKDKIEALDLKDEDLSYHRLYELGHPTLAEHLSELENENNSDESSSIMFELTAFLARGETEGTRTMHLAVAVNWEAPYHRSGKANEWFKELSFDFNNEFTLKSEITSKLKELTGYLV